MTARSRLWPLLTACVLLSGGGCEDIDLNLEPAAQRPARPRTGPIESRPPASRPAEFHETPETSVRVEPGFHRLILTRASPPADAPPGPTYRPLARAAPRQASELLSMLILPSGSSGSSARATLIYPTAAECTAAAGRVKELDQPAASAPDPARTPGSYADGIAMLYGAMSESGGRTQLYSAAEQLETLAGRAETPRPQRWAIRMLAAGVLADRLNERRLAAEAYGRAVDDAAPGSLEHLTSLYSQGRTLLQSGQTRAGRRILERVIGQFGAMRRTEPFERARRLLSEMDANRSARSAGAH